MADDLPESPRPRRRATSDDVLGKLDQLLHKHRAGTAESGAAPVPDAHRVRCAATTTPVPGTFPRLRGHRKRPRSGARAGPAPNTSPAANASAVLEAGVNLRLAVKLESERARLLDEARRRPPMRAQASTN